MEAEKLQIVMGADKSADVTIREGKAPEKLQELPPIKIEIHGNIGAISEYLSKRVNAKQFEQKDCHITVNRNDGEINLILNESDPYRYGLVSGSIKIDPSYASLKINMSESWAPTELAMFLKMNRAMFTDKAENMKLVSTLLHFKADINNKIERLAKENGDRTDNFSQIVNSNLPSKFSINVPIIKGDAPSIVEVETFASIDGREVRFFLISAGAQEVIDTERNTKIDAELDKIRTIAPEIAIIEI